MNFRDEYTKLKMLRKFHLSWHLAFYSLASEIRDLHVSVHVFIHLQTMQMSIQIVLIKIIRVISVWSAWTTACDEQFATRM